MNLLYDPFSSMRGFDLTDRIRARAEACGIDLGPPALDALAQHARAVLRENEELHLTSITEPEEFLERHVGESLEGAALLDPDVEGPLLDVGSGNGYPGLPLALARPGLQVLLAEASMRKAGFLRSVIREAPIPNASVLEAQVQRPADVEGLEPIRVLTSRAMGGWAKILPRLHALLSDDGELLVWAGPEMEAVSRRVVWRRFEIRARHPLPGRESSWIWRVQKK